MDTDWCNTRKATIHMAAHRRTRHAIRPGLLPGETRLAGLRGLSKWDKGMLRSLDGLQCSAIDMR